ncbi:MAG: histidine kinase dimerization/phospho-acceptor domain-containing protein [Polaribacter sp.]|uniref:histidine kinase dimerization/phospho-acceptor domain-containing protein n=1 Tax=Polaribacter sp. TaxID=1920175 RepID=UPI003BAEA159
MKFFLLFSLFILSSFTLSCNELSFQNDTIVNYTTNKYNELYKKKSSIEDLDKHVYANLRELRDFISQKKNIADSSLIELKDTYANYLVLLQGDYFMFKGEIDSVIHYNNKVRDYTNNYYLLGRAESITSYAYQIKNRYAEQIISLKKAIDYYDKSNHIHANYRKSELQIFLFGVYNNYKLFSTAENLIPIIEVSLKITKEQIHANKDLSPLIPFIKNKEVTFNLEKCKTLLLKNKRKEVLIIVKKLEDEVPENNIFKHHFYNTLAEIFFELGEKDKALKLYKKAYNTDFFNPKKDIIGEKYKNLTFASIYSEVNDMSTADKYFDSFIKDTVGLNIYQNPTAQGLLANYYNNKKNYKKAINYLKRKYFLNDSISQNGLEIANQIYAKELQFDKKIITLEQKAKQEQLLAEKQETKLKSTILIALLIFIILGISFYFFTKNRRTKAKLELAKTKEVLAFKNIFLENISHEMRTPITVILGYLTLIKENSLNPERIANYANLASVNTTNFLHSLNSFLTVKKLEKTSDLKLVEENRILLNFFKDTIIDFTQLAKGNKLPLNLYTI